MNIIMKVELTLTANESGNESDNLSWNENDNQFVVNLIFDNESWNCMRVKIKL